MSQLGTYGGNVMAVVPYKVPITRGRLFDGDEQAASIIRTWDTSNMVTTDRMFYKCSNLINAPLFDTGNVQDMSEMFAMCTHLMHIPLYDTSSVTQTTSMFGGCYLLEDVPELDMSSVIGASGMFGSCYALSTIRFLGMKASFAIEFTALQHDALVVLLNNLGEPSEQQTLRMGESKLALLSASEKAIATNKNWRLI